MISQPVLSRMELEQKLRDRGCAPTQNVLATGRLWLTRAKTPFMVPHPDQADNYPDWMLYDLWEIVGKIAPWSN